ncbi:MAG: hypothetical protein PHY14_00715 [Candidatus Gracilibacteria bacterium]|nr:hypothetical protein [Candidatus Gracilibacteria bacterium]
MEKFSRIGAKTIILASIALVAFSGFSSSVVAYSTRYQQQASTFVDNYIERLQRGGYSTSDMTQMLIDLRSTYVKKQKSHLYTGSALQNIEAVIDELDSAIAGVSEGACGTCDVYDNFNVYVPPKSNYYNNYNYPYYNGYNYNYNYNNSTYYPYYPYNSYTSTVSNETVRALNVVLTSNNYNSTEIRTDIVRENTNNSYKTYDVYTFVPQSSGYSNSQPASSQFVSPSLSRQFSTLQGRTVSTYFGVVYDYNRVRNIRSSAESATKTAQSTLSSYASFSDTYRSPSPDDFSRQAVWNGSTRTYRFYRLYVARDNSQAFVVEYVESGSGYNGYYQNNGYSQYNGYSQNISGIDTNSFTDNGSYFTHTYRTVNGYSKRYKQYIYTPSAGSNPSTVISNLGINSRATYQKSTNRSQYVNSVYTNTAINGYTVNSGYVNSVESSFSSYGYSSSYVTLPGSNSQISFAPRTGYDFQYARLSDNTYRMYRLLVAEDGSDAYVTEYIQNQPNY